MRRDVDTAGDVVLAEAAAWLARLQGPSRTAAAEAAFREWLTADPAHGHAFARATDVWDVLPGAMQQSRGGAADRCAETGPEARRVPRWAAPALLAASAAFAWIAIVILPLSYSTGVGEQHTIALGDGTRVTLNTDSKLSVNYNDAERRVRLDRGEAMFEVARNPNRPFVVEAGDEQVRALGTTFVVRLDQTQVAVTLIEGHVEVTEPHQVVSQEISPSKVAVLSPGERVTMRADTASVAVDRPKVEAVTAWRRGEVMFDDVSLADAVAEINRYGRTHVVVPDAALARLRVSGVFETRDPGEFAQAMAKLHGLTALRSGADIVLGR